MTEERRINLELDRVARNTGDFEAFEILLAEISLRDSSGSHMPNAAEREKIKIPILYRSFEIPRDAAGNASSLNQEKRTVKVQFSSEAPVQRWFGTEILDHRAGSVDMKRVKKGTAVCYEHGQRIGITESGTITSDGVGEAEIRFAKTAIGNDMLMEVADGTLRWVSVGYHVRHFDVNEDTNEWRAIDWEPLEVSLVGIPADTSCKIYRSNQTKEEHEVTVMRTRSHPLLDKAATEGGGGVSAPNIIDKPTFDRELDEAREILALAAHYQRKCPKIGEAAEKALKDKTPIAKFQRQVMELLETSPSEDISAPAIGDGHARQHRAPVSPGQRFIESEAYKRAVASGSPQARRSISIQIPDEFQFRADSALLTRATFSAGTEAISGTAGANIDVRPGVPGILGLQQLFVADLFAQGTTNGDTIRYIREDTFTNAATRVAEGAAKPEGALDISIVNATVEKTAVFLNVTDEMLADFAQMSSFINGRLGYMVQQLEDQQLISGSGTNQIRGILNTSGIQTISGAANTIDQYLRAIEYVRGANGVGFGQPDAIIINPLNWLSARLSKDTNGQYLFGGPGYAPYGMAGYSNVGMMWGIPVVSTTAIAAGTALVGAFRTAAQIFRRQGLTIESTNSHASLFVSNIVTIRAEQRLALAVYQPPKFCSITAIP